MSDDRVIKAVDLFHTLLFEYENIKSLVDVLHLGFENNHYDDRRCEIASINILGKYMGKVQDDYMKPLKELLESMRDNPHYNGG